MSQTLDSVKRLLPGQSIKIDRRELELDYHYMRHNGAEFNPADCLLENIVGSSYEYGYRVDFLSGSIEFFRLNEPIKSDDRSYVSPDQRKYYRFDGRIYRMITAAS